MDLKSGTFGDINKYKMLKTVYIELDLLNSKDKNKICSLIERFNFFISKMKIINPKNDYFFFFLKEKIIEDFNNRIEAFECNNNLKTHIKCFLRAKIRNLSRKIKTEKNIKKISVKGCFECPFSYENDASPIFSFGCFLKKDKEITDTFNYQPITPEWCPLEFENFIITKNKCITRTRKSK